MELEARRLEWRAFIIGQRTAHRQAVVTDRFCLPDLAPAVVQLWKERERWFTALDGLPQTYCHHDIWPGNVRLGTAAGSQFWLLIDWECSGHGVVGVDIGNWIGTCPLNGDVPSALAPVFAAGVLEQFVAGLRAS